MPRLHAIYTTLDIPPPLRVTKSLIARFIGQEALIFRKIDKLPLTKIAIRSVVEDDIQFVTRRISWAISEIIQIGDTPKKWKIIRKSGIVRQLNQPRIQQLVDNLLLPFG